MALTLRSVLTALAALALAALAAFVIWAVLIRPGQLAQDAKRAEATSAYAQGDARASAAATGAVADLGERNQARDQLSRETADEINSLPGATLRVDPDVHSAGRRRNCLRDAYRDTPACVRLRQQDTAAAPR